MFKSVFKTGIRAVYDVLGNPSFVSEPWSVYPAKHKTTGKLASVFIFDKSKFESAIYKLCTGMSNTKNPKVIISECYELIKHEVSQLLKLKHPQILTLYEVLEETKLKFIFATEPVVDNLATVDFDKLDELSTQKGLLEVCKGLQFLHNFGSIVHLNIQPSSVYINLQGDWKLSGFRFLQNLNEVSPTERDNFYIMNNTSIVPFVNMNLNFTAPEHVIDTQLKLDFANDIWALGCLIFYIFNRGEYLINCFDANSISDFKSEFRKFESKFYNHRVSDLKYVLKEIPTQLYAIYPSILARYPHDRPTIDQIIDSDYFNGSLVKAMWFVDEFPTKSLEDRKLFLGGLLEKTDNKLFLHQFPQTFKTNKLLPLLVEFLKSELSANVKDESLNGRIDAVCYALRLVLEIGSGLSSLTFHDRVYEPLFVLQKKKKDRIDYFDKLINFSVKVRLTLVQGLEILIDKLNNHDLVEVIKRSTSLIMTLPSNEQHFKAEQIKTQDLFLSKVGLFIDKFDFPYIKNDFFPIICQVFKTTSILSTKLATITVFEDVVDQGVIDKIIITEQLLPIFQNLKSRDKRIVGTVLKFFNKLSQNSHISLESEVIVESILPICFKLAFSCNECTQSEFKGYMKLIDEIQAFLVKRKLPDLPTKVPASTTTREQTSSFDSLINSQSINTNNLDRKVTGPQSSVMTPKSLNSTRGSTILQSASHINKSSSPVLQPKRNVQPLKLQPEPRARPNLSFGSTGPKNTLGQAPKFSSLEGTFDNEFLDFQSATPTTSQTSSRVSTPTYNFTPLVPNHPPGFSGTVLSPNVHNNGKPQSNSDSILDLI